jgi:glycosyltransferase involved in cell wall biosynthesis
MTLGVVIPCYRQERYLARTLAAIESALAGRTWRGALVMAAGGAAGGAAVGAAGGSTTAALPPLSPHWQLIAPPVEHPLTPGGARMLGFAACGGTWVLFVDADVEVDREWVEAALATAGRHPDIGGLWGRLEEWFEEPSGRERPGSPDMYRVGGHERATDYMATLAFYRRDALLEAGGYDTRLSNEEDFELGLRFRRLGRELRSLGMRAGRHWSAPRPSFAELARRWRTGLCFGQGQVLRLYLGRPGFGVLLRRQALYLATLALWGLGLAAVGIALASRVPWPVLAWLLLLFAVIAAMTVRKRSARLGLLSVLTWTLNGLGLAVGLMRGGPALPGAGAGEARC